MEDQEDEEIDCEWRITTCWGNWQGMEDQEAKEFNWNLIYFLCID